MDDADNLDKFGKVAAKSLAERPHKEPFRKDRLLLDTDPSNYIEINFASFLGEDGAIGYLPVFSCRNCEDDLRFIVQFQKFECQTCGCSLSVPAACFICDRYVAALTNLANTMLPKKPKKRGWRWPWAKS